MKRLALILLHLPALLFASAWLLSVTAPTLLDLESPGRRTYFAVAHGALYAGRYTNTVYKSAPTKLQRWDPQAITDHESTFRRYNWQFTGFGVLRGGRALTHAGDRGYAVYRIPLWAPTFASAVPPLTLLLLTLYRRRRTVRRRAKGLCPACGYDLRATTTQCPECGATSASSSAAV